MPDIIQQFFTGPDIAAINIYAVTAIATDGTLTYAAPSGYLTYWRDFTYQHKVGKRNTKPSSQRGANNQIVQDDWTLTISGHVKNLTGVTAAVPAALIAFMFLYDIFKVQITRGGTVMTLVGSRGDGNESAGAEESIESLVFDRVHINSANPVYASVL